MTITNSTISDNIGLEEGAGGILNSGTMNIINSTVALNRISTFDGAGIRNSGILAIVNSTISANDAGNRFGLGGGIFNFSTGSVELTNVILAMNRGAEGPDCSGPITSRGNNLIGDISGCDINLLPTDLVGDPGLGEFIDDAPPGQGHFPLLSNSQAIDRGNPKACPKLDQLGNPRVGVCDIGSVEFQGRTPLLTVRRDVIRAGRSIVARWRAIPAPTSTDWIGLYLPGTSNTAFIDWIYVSFSKTPGNPDRRGSCDFPIPESLAPGTYELRLLANDGFMRLASSDGFLVRPSRDSLAFQAP